MSRTRVIGRCFSLPTAVVLLGAIAGAATTARAQTPTTQPPVTTAAPAQTPAQQVGPREHVVKKGDTLWDLAAFYYGNPYLWTIIYNANKPVVENPHWIYPVEKLIIPGRDTAVVAPLGQPVPNPVMVTVETVQAPVDTTPTRVVTPEPPRALVSASEYLTAPWLSTDPQRSIAGRLVRVADPTTQSDRIPQQLLPNDKVLIGEIHGSFRKGDSVQIVRLGRTIGTYGRVVEPMGILRVDSVGATVIAATLVKHFGTAKIGDYIMPLGTIPTFPRGEYTAVTTGTEAQLLQFAQARVLHGTGDLAFVSLGSDQVRIGDELAVYTPEQKIDNERPEVLPKTTVGVVRVIKVTDHSATVRVVGVRNTGMIDGLPARLVRRAP